MAAQKTLTKKSKANSKIVRVKKKAIRKTHQKPVISKRLVAQYQKAYKQLILAWHIIRVTGNNPLQSVQIEKFAERNGAYVTDGGVWQDDGIVIIGREEFDEEFLRESVQAGISNNFRCAYMSQEAFIKFIESGIYPAYYRGDPRIKDHPGLTFLTSIGFVWPKTKFPITGATVDNPFGSSSNDYAFGWQESHPLRYIYGYSVQKGISEIERQIALRQAIRKNGLGLRAVAEHIAWLIKERKRHRGNRMEEAIERWEDDLDWLYENFYKKSLYSFIWPDIEE